MQKISPQIWLSFTLALGTFVLGSDSLVFAQNTLITDADNPSAIGGATSAWGGSLRQAILATINFFLYFLGVIATGMVIYGGYLYITSMGEDSKMEEGKKVLTYAAIGIIMILLSFAIVNTITNLGSGDRNQT